MSGCCCGSGGDDDPGGDGKTTQYCDACPPAIGEHQCPEWQVKVNHGLIRSCSYGGGLIWHTFNNGPCACGTTCSMRVMESDQAAGHSVDNDPQPPAGCDPTDRYAAGCENCPPIAGVVPSAPGGVSTFRVAGCRHVDGNTCNAVTPNNCTINAFPNCCQAVGHNNFWTYDDVADGLISISGIERCRRKLLPNALCGWNGADPANLNLHSRITIMFGLEDLLYKISLMDCVPNPQGGFEWQCNFDPPNGYYSMAGTYWLCEYVREQRPCEWFATGRYRLVSVQSNGCYLGSLRNPNNPLSCSYCSMPAGMKLCLNDWNGVDLGSLGTTWKPPSDILVTRLH